MSVLIAFLLFFTACTPEIPPAADTGAADALAPVLTPPEPDPAPWSCEDGVWAWSEVVVDDDCAGDEGFTWSRDDTEIACIGEGAFLWRVGNYALPCLAEDDGAFTCTLTRTVHVGDVEGRDDLHTHTVTGRFSGQGFAEGTWEHRITFLGPEPTNFCAAVAQFVAQAW